MNTLTANSPAKINLTLRVRGVRPDGYHDIESLVVRVNLLDKLTVRAHEDGCYALDCDDPALPTDGSNLVLLAAKALNKAAGTNHGADITLTKRIPAGTGLGGGSSNAATTLRLLNEMWQTRLSDAELAQIGAGLGSDVPLFFCAPACIIRGRGEEVEPLPPLREYWLALVMPALYCATPAVYREWDRQTSPAGGRSLQAVLAARGSAATFMELLFNDLEQPAFRVAPELGALVQRIDEITAQTVRMTGSGSALFRIFDDPKTASQFALRVATECNVRVDVVSLQNA